MILPEGWTEVLSHGPNGETRLLQDARTHGFLSINARTGLFCLGCRAPTVYTGAVKSREWKEHKRGWHSRMVTEAICWFEDVTGAHELRTVNPKGVT